MDHDQVYDRRRGDVTGGRRLGGHEAARPWLPRLVAHAIDLLMPVPCLACGGATDGVAREIGLCRPCFGGLARWPKASCAACGRPLSPPVPLGFRCGRCRKRRASLNSMSSVWRYRPPLDAVIGGLKFRRLDYLGPRLGRVSATAIRDVLPPVTAVTAVPLHPLRRLTRGYDQAALIARGVATVLGLPFVPTLRRRRWTTAQSRLPRAARLLNPRGAFALRRGLWAHRPRRTVLRHRWLLVDDVCTTGATLESAATCLAGAGAAAVHGFACARADGENPP